jgi:hypothetical protein
MISTAMLRIAGKRLGFMMMCLCLSILSVEIKIILSRRGKRPQKKGEPTMALVRYTLDIGTELTPEEHAAIRAELAAARKLPFVYDPECPPLTDEELAEFHPVNGMTWEERARLMRERGIVNPDEPAEQNEAVRVPALA